MGVLRGNLLCATSYCMLVGGVGVGKVVNGNTEGRRDEYLYRGRKGGRCYSW